MTKSFRLCRTLVVAAAALLNGPRAGAQEHVVPGVVSSVVVSSVVVSGVVVSSVGVSSVGVSSVVVSSVGVSSSVAQGVMVQGSAAQPHVIDLLADRDSRYKMAGERTPEVTVKAGEQVLLRVTARRGKSWNRDGSIHGFTLLRAKDRTRVDGWDLLFKPGKQEFQLTAPAEAGEYIVVCTVICSEDHEGMHMKFTVLP